MIQLEIEKLSSGNLLVLFFHLQDEMLLWQMRPGGVLRLWLHEHIHAPNFYSYDQLH